MKTKTKETLKGNKGFSFLEILISASVLVSLTLISATVMENVKLGSKKVEKKAIKKGNEEWLNSFLYKFISLNNIGISYGVLNIADDNGKNFLDFLPDYHSLGLTNKKRIFTLENNKKIIFLSGLSDTRRFKVMELFDYDYNRMLTGDTPSDAYFNDCYLKKEIGDLWESKGLLLFYIPAFLRKDIPVNMHQFPKKPAFLADMVGTRPPSNCAKVTTSATSFGVQKYTKLQSVYFNFNNPAPSTIEQFQNIKKFVLGSHLIGGQDAILVKRVQVIVLAIEDNRVYQCIIKNNDQNLTCDQNTGLLFAEDIEYIKFEREDVSNTQMKISFKFLD